MICYDMYNYYKVGRMSKGVLSFGRLTRRQERVIEATDKTNPNFSHTFSKNLLLLQATLINLFLHFTLLQ